MIIQPNFLDHWKTHKLVALLEDPCAPLYLIRLWAHCQNQRSDVLPSDPVDLCAICKCNAKAEKLKEALIKSGFVDEHKKNIVAHGWKDTNKRLFSNRENGKRGGRPQGKAKENPSVSDGLADESPKQTSSKGRRVEKSREDKNNSPPNPQGGHESEGDDCPERFRPAFEALWATGKIPNLTPQLVAEVDKFHPNTPLSEHYAVVALELKHITGVVGNPLRWLVDSIRKNVEQKKIRPRREETLGGENCV